MPMQLNCMSMYLTDTDIISHFIANLTITIKIKVWFGRSSMNLYKSYRQSNRAEELYGIFQELD